MDILGKVGKRGVAADEYGITDAAKNYLGYRPPYVKLLKPLVLAATVAFLGLAGHLWLTLVVTIINLTLRAVAPAPVPPVQ